MSPSAQDARGPEEQDMSATEWRAPGNDSRTGRLVLELAVKVGILLDHRLEDRPVDGVAAGLLLDVAHLDHAVGALQDEVGLAARVDHGGLLTLGDLGV